MSADELVFKIRVKWQSSEGGLALITFLCIVRDHSYGEGLYSQYVGNIYLNYKSNWMRIM